MLKKASVTSSVGMAAQHDRHRFGVWFLVFGHGAADMTDGRRLARQLLTPEDPSIGTPHLGVTPDGYPVANALFVGL